MKHFVGLSIVASLAILATACSSSNNNGNGSGNGDSDSGAHTGPAADSGATPDSGNTSGNDSGASGDDAGSCGPITVASGTVPTYTLPTLGKEACAAADITAFVTACGANATSSSCGTWLNTAGADGGPTSCATCVLGETTIAPLELLSLGTNQNYLIPSAGACIIATSGSAASACAVDADEFNYCIQYACNQCTDDTSFQDCATTAETGACGTSGTALQTDCAAYKTAYQSCGQSQPTDTQLAAEANVFCGSGDAGTVAPTDASAD